jgi:exopolyphosphatase/guanosine-5'-triphosphate,3'-diphosphate pyrophosphatase
LTNRLPALVALETETDPIEVEATSEVPAALVPETIAAIDIGTNSIHLVVARVVGQTRFEVLDREKEVVRLGSGSGDMKLLAPDAIDRGIEVLKRFRQVADISGAEVHAVATSAVREAENRDVFITRAAEEAGMSVQVISGVEEARLIHLGVLQALPVFDQQLLLIDIGGGSTEILIGRGPEVLEARSVKLGAIRLTDRFFRAEPLTKQAVEDCRQFIRAYLSPVTRTVRSHGFDVAAGSSGTIVNLAEMIQARRDDPLARGINNFSFTRQELAELVKALVRARTVRARAALPGLDPKRADIILGGALLLEQSMVEMGVPSLVVSDFALREGVLFDALRRVRGTTVHHLADLRYRSVRHLADICPDERDHAEHTSRLALQLYDGCRDLHRLDEACREYLEAAALLANVGQFISHSRHHLHSYYIIRNSEQLTGFTDHEIELIAQVARYHRKSAPKDKHPEFARLSRQDQDVVRKLAGMLRVAIGLDRTEAGVVRRLSCHHDDGVLSIRLETTGADASMEVYTATARRGLLEEALGVEVGFVLATPRARKPGSESARRPR